MHKQEVEDHQNIHQGCWKPTDVVFTEQFEKDNEHEQSRVEEYLSRWMEKGESSAQLPCQRMRRCVPVLLRRVAPGPSLPRTIRSRSQLMCRSWRLASSIVSARVGLRSEL
jgi:hypothetical protein